MGLAMVFMGLSGIGHYDGTVAAQASSTCAPLTTDEIEMIANSSGGEGADVGEAAVFKVDSALYVHGTALVKGRMLQLRLYGFEAREKKGGVISLLKSAASRL